MWALADESAHRGAFERLWPPSSREVLDELLPLAAGLDRLSNTSARFALHLADSEQYARQPQIESETRVARIAHVSMNEG